MNLTEVDKTLFRSIILLLALAAIALNLVYFAKSRKIFRWIKLVYAANNFVMATYMTLSLLGYQVGILAQYVMIILLLLNIVAGAILSLFTMNKKNER